MSRWGIPEEAIRLKLDYSAAHRGMGRALERARRVAEARAAFARRLEVAAGTGDLQTKKEVELFFAAWKKVAGNVDSAGHPRIIDCTSGSARRSSRLRSWTVRDAKEVST